jgi:hypothetical protein
MSKKVSLITEDISVCQFAYDVIGSLFKDLIKDEIKNYNILLYDFIEFEDCIKDFIKHFEYNGDTYKFRIPVLFIPKNKYTIPSNINSLDGYLLINIDEITNAEYIEIDEDRILVRFEDETDLIPKYKIDIDVYIEDIDEKDKEKNLKDYEEYDKKYKLLDNIKLTINPDDKIYNIFSTVINSFYWDLIEFEDK